jgi:hypothetical protein
MCDTAGSARLRQIFENRKNDALNAAVQKSGILKRKFEPFCVMGCGGANAWVVSGGGEAVQNRGTFAPKNKFLSAMQNAKVAAGPQDLTVPETTSDQYA